MTFIPLFKTACELAQNIPNHIADFLELDYNLRRRFREESVSDLIVACLLKLPYREMVVLIPEETKTGSDFDIIIVDEMTEEAIQFRIQAKRLTPHASNWEMGSYRELAHPHNTGKQASTLIRSSSHEAMPTIPLYAFYNPRSVCDQSADAVSGIELADGRLINQLIKTMVKAKPKRIPNKRIQTLHPLFFPLTDILCKPFKTLMPGDTGIPSPEVFKRIALETIESRNRSFVEVIGLQEPAVRIGTISTEKRLAAPLKDKEAEQFTFDERTLIKKPQLPLPIKKAITNRQAQKIVRTHTPRPRFILVSDPSS